jgi:glycosyltransferase involved in cell wall biosynthesis
LKIICIGPAFPLRGGISNFNTTLCRNLAGAGHQASIISFSLQYPSFLFPGATQFEPGESPEGIEIRPLINSINPLSWLRTARIVRRESPDLVILHHWMPFMAVGLGTIVRRMDRRRNFPVIAVCHNVVPHEKQAGWKLLTRYLLSRCDGFIVLSRSVLDDLSMFTESEHKVFVPHPVYDIFGEGVTREEAARYLGLDPGDKYLLFFGLVRKYKGLDLLLDAFARVKEEIENLKLVIAGEFYERKDEYLEQIAKSGMGDRILLHDRFIPSGEVKYYFCLADLVVQPYRTATQSGISQIAYHFGVPMVVTGVGGLSEIVPHGRVGYVTDVDEKAVAEAILDFFCGNRAGEFRSNIQTEKKRFSWDAMGSQIIELAGSIREKHTGSDWHVI